jgi:hypothetical protein
MAARSLQPSAPRGARRATSEFEQADFAALRWGDFEPIATM